MFKDPESDYMGPNRLRPRLDYADPPIFHGTRHHGRYLYSLFILNQLLDMVNYILDNLFLFKFFFVDSFGSGSGQYPPDYYASDVS